MVKFYKNDDLIAWIDTKTDIKQQKDVFVNYPLNLKNVQIYKYISLFRMRIS